MKTRSKEIIEDEEYIAMERKQLFAKQLYLKAFLPSMRKPREDKDHRGRDRFRARGSAISSRDQEGGRC